MDGHEQTICESMINFKWQLGQHHLQSGPSKWILETAPSGNIAKTM
jgi:hypothetical protein